MIRKRKKIASKKKRKATRPPNPLVEVVGELTQTNKDLHEAHRAALNLMEDTILSKDALRKSEEKYRALFESIDEGFAICELVYDKKGNAIDFRFLETNHAYEKLEGQPSPEGKLCSEVSPGLQARWFDHFEKVGRTCEPVRIEEYDRETGRWYNTYITCVGGTGTNQLCSVWNDITEQKKSEISLRESEEKLKNFNTTLEHEVHERSKELKNSQEDLFQKNQQLNQTVSQLETFNYIASHDLREPLRKIQTYVKLATEKDMDPGKLNAYLDKVLESSVRMNQLINDLLDYSRLSRPNEGFQEVDLNKTLNEVKSDYEIQIKEKKAEIENSPLPTICGVPFQMHQLFANLISNALKFNKGTPHIQITANTLVNGEVEKINGLDPKRKYEKIVFEDNGIGFDNQYKEKIFELFQRLHSKSEYGGTGIGLGIVDKIAKNHHGRVVANGGEGTGAIFSVYLAAE